MTLDEERKLLQWIKSDPREFSAVFDVLYKPVFGYIFRRVADYDISRDIAADTFLKAYQKIGSFEWKNISLSSWIYRIATNEINQHFRREKYLPRPLSHFLEEHDLDIPNDQDYEAERESLERELKAHNDYITIQKHIKTFDVKYQEVIALRYFESKSIKEISEILEKNEGTVKSLLSRGIEKLKILMDTATKT